MSRIDVSAFDTNVESENIDFKRRFKPWTVGQEVVFQHGGCERRGVIKDYANELSTVLLRNRREEETPFVRLDLSEESGVRYVNNALMGLPTVTEGFYRCPEALSGIGTALIVKSTAGMRCKDSGEWFACVVDGFDARSQRIHVNYGRDWCEWLWPSASNCSLFAGQLAEFIPTEVGETVKAPPFDAVAYGLAVHFPNKATQSDAQPLRKRVPKKRRTPDEFQRDATPTHSRSGGESKKRRKLNSAESNGSQSRTQLHSSPIALTAEVSDLSIESENEQSTTSTTTSTTTATSTISSAKRRKRKLLSYVKRYPRKAKIKGVRWLRRHSGADKKYFWVREDDRSQSSWNPWADRRRKAPWQTRFSWWVCFEESRADGERRRYWTNLKTDLRQYSPPPQKEYEGEEVIEYDSATDAYWRKEEAKIRARLSPKSSTETTQSSPLTSSSTAKGLFDTTELNSLESTLTALSAPKRAKRRKRRRKRAQAADSSLPKAPSSDSCAEIVAKFAWSKLEAEVQQNPDVHLGELIDKHCSGIDISQDAFQLLEQMHNKSVVPLLQQMARRKFAATALRSKTSASGKEELEDSDSDKHMAAPNAEGVDNEWMQLKSALASGYTANCVDALRFAVDALGGADTARANKCLAVLLSEATAECLRKHVFMSIKENAQLAEGAFELVNTLLRPQVAAATQLTASRFFNLLSDKGLRSMLKAMADLALGTAVDSSASEGLAKGGVRLKMKRILVQLLCALGRHSNAFQVCCVECVANNRLLSTLFAVDKLTNAAKRACEHNAFECGASGGLSRRQLDEVLNVLRIANSLCLPPSRLRNPRALCGAYMDCIRDLLAYFGSLPWDSVLALVSAVLKYASEVLAFVETCAAAHKAGTAVRRPRAVETKVLCQLVEECASFVANLCNCDRPVCTLHIKSFARNNCLVKVLYHDWNQRIQGAAAQAFDVTDANSVIATVANEENNVRLEDVYSAESRESIADLMLSFFNCQIPEVSRVYVLVGRSFRELLKSTTLAHMSVGWNQVNGSVLKRDNLSVEWIKSELLCQLDRDEPGVGQQLRHRNACKLLEMVLSPLCYDRLWNEDLREAEPSDSQPSLSAVLSALYTTFAQLSSAVPQLLSESNRVEIQKAIGVTPQPMADTPTATVWIKFGHFSRFWQGFKHVLRQLKCISQLVLSDMAKEAAAAAAKRSASDSCVAAAACSVAPMRVAVSEPSVATPIACSKLRQKLAQCHSALDEFCGMFSARKSGKTERDTDSDKSAEPLDDSVLRALGNQNWEERVSGALRAAFCGICDSYDGCQYELCSLLLRGRILHILIGLIVMEPSSSLSVASAVKEHAKRAKNALLWTLCGKLPTLLPLTQLPYLCYVCSLHTKCDYSAPTGATAPTSITPCLMASVSARHSRGGDFTMVDRMLQHEEARHALASAASAHSPLVIGPFSNNRRTLVVGDGNLSFGRALCRKFGQFDTLRKLDARKRKPCLVQVADNWKQWGASNVVVTCYESAIELLKRYPHSGSVVSEIEQRGGLVLYGVDARKLTASLNRSLRVHGGDRRPFPLFEAGASARAVAGTRFETIIWNFPQAIENSINPVTNGQLVEDFLRSALPLLASVGAEILVTLHCDIYNCQDLRQGQLREQFNTWRVEERARHCGLLVSRCEVLRHWEYPGYAIKNVTGNPFNIVTGLTYVFEPIAHAKAHGHAFL